MWFAGFQPQRWSAEFGRRCRIRSLKQARYLSGPLKRGQLGDGDGMEWSGRQGGEKSAIDGGTVRRTVLARWDGFVYSEWSLSRGQ